MLVIVIDELADSQSIATRVRKMTNTESRAYTTRQSLTEQFLERYQGQPKFHRMADTAPKLEKEFQFPSQVWKKLRTKQ